MLLRDLKFKMVLLKAFQGKYLQGVQVKLMLNQAAKTVKIIDAAVISKAIKGTEVAALINEFEIKPIWFADRESGVVFKKEGKDE